MKKSLKFSKYITLIILILIVKDFFKATIKPNSKIGGEAIPVNDSY